MASVASQCSEDKDEFSPPRTSDSLVSPCTLSPGCCHARAPACHHVPRSSLTLSSSFLTHCLSTVGLLPHPCTSPLVTPAHFTDFSFLREAFPDTSVTPSKMLSIHHFPVPSLHCINFNLCHLLFLAQCFLGE